VVVFIFCEGIQVEDGFLILTVAWNYFSAIQRYLSIALGRFTQHFELGNQAIFSNQTLSWLM